MIRCALLLAAVGACTAAQPVWAAPKGRIVPYVGASQTVGADFDTTGSASGDEVLLRDGAIAYSSLTVGAEGAATTRRAAIAVSVRYEQRIEQAGDDGADSRVEGVVRGRLALVPGLVTLDAGGIATRIGDDVASQLAEGKAANTQRYALFAGPQWRIERGELRFTGHYRLGYAWSDTADSMVRAPVQAPSQADGSVPFLAKDTPPSSAAWQVTDISHSASVQASVLPDNLAKGTAFSLTGNWERQESSRSSDTLKITRSSAGVAAAVPINTSLSLVGEIGYERLRIRQWFAGNGYSLFGITPPYESASGGIFHYETSGIAGVAGLVWRPSRRTQAEAYAGRRFGSQTYYGSISLAPTRRSRATVRVYDRVTTYNAGLIAEASDLSPDFEGISDPLSGALNPCVSGRGDNRSGHCFTGALAPDRSLAFRGRGASFSLNYDRKPTQLGLGAGYDQRRYYGQQLPRMPPGTASSPEEALPAPSDSPLKDQVWWLSAQASHAVDRRSNLSVTAQVQWLGSRAASQETRVTYQASVAYSRTVSRHMQLRAAGGLDGGAVERITPSTALSGKNNYVISSVRARVLIGFRYSF